MTACAYSALTAGTILLAASLLAVLGLTLPAHPHSRRPRRVAPRASELDPSTMTAVDAAYHAKYDRYGPQIVGTVTGAHAAAVTLRLDPDQAT